MKSISVLTHTRLPQVPTTRILNSLLCVNPSSLMGLRNIKNVPADILLDIIARLPTESVLECKLVCRLWRNLVCSHNPPFSQMHLSHLNHPTTADSGKLSFLVKDKNQQLHYFEFNDTHDEIPLHSIRGFNLAPPFASTYYKVIGSVNGLVCLHGYGDHTTCICNPLTKEYVLLPNVKNNDHNIHCSTGFGYLPLTNEYKVVEVYELWTEPGFTKVAVYTLGNGNGWRSVGKFDNMFGEAYVEHSVFVNGALYWVDSVGGLVFVFDLAEEKFGNFSTPPLPLEKARYDFSIGVIGAALYYAIRYYCQITGCIWSDIWLQKNKNDEPLGWSEEFRLLGREPLAFTNSGGVLYFDGSSLGIYNAITSTSEKLVDSTAFIQISPHKNTLVSLRELGEEDIKLMESVENEELASRDQLGRWSWIHFLVCYLISCFDFLPTLLYVSSLLVFFAYVFLIYVL